MPAGWDAALEQGMRDHEEGRMPTALSALAAVVARDHLGQGLSSTLIRAMKNVAAARGLASLIAPVRPSTKSHYPLTPIERYVHRTGEDGAPFDPWLRTHWRLGAAQLAIAHRSMVITGTVAPWERWTEMRFPNSGPYVVPGALVPITINREDNQGRYEEPNVWMRHQIANGKIVTQHSQGDAMGLFQHLGGAPGQVPRW